MDRMLPQVDHGDGNRGPSQSSVHPHTRLRQLLAVLASRAKWLGSPDPESAVQETLKRSLQNAAARVAIEFYFSEDHADRTAPPAWPLDRLFAWLHTVLTYVVRDENGRASRWREIPMGTITSGGLNGGRLVDPADPSPDSLEQMLDREVKAVVAESFPKLARDYRTVLHMRLNGMKYSEIADRMGVSENTVATWKSRATRELGQHVRRYTERAPPSSAGRNGHR